MTDIVEQAAETTETVLESEYGGHQTPVARLIAQALADAGLLRDPARTVPTREEVAAVTHLYEIDENDRLMPRTRWEMADAVLALMDRQPTVAEVKAAALEEAADAWHAENTGTSPRAYRWLQHRAQEYRLDKGE